MTIRAITNEKSFLVAPGYPHEILAPLLVEVGAELNRTRGTGAPIIISTKVSEPTEGSFDDDHLGLKDFKAAEKNGSWTFLQPADSKIAIHDQGNSKAYRVSPMGIRKGSKGLLGFSIAWNLFTLVFTIVFISICLAGDLFQGWNLVGSLLFALFACLFWLVGIGSLVSAINAGRRTAMLGIADGQLFVERKSIFGTKWLELPIGKIKKIGVGPSGTEINNVPVLELQIRDSAGHKHGLLSQLANDDLFWLAQELSKSLDAAKHQAVSD